MPYTITKTYSNLKAAHRQWRHKGHCRFIHGENWTFKITFIADNLDDKNFVVDFGELRPLKAMLDDLFDHTLLIDHDDPNLEMFKALEKADSVRLIIVPSASAEGLAKLVWEHANKYIVETTDGRVRIHDVVCEEDSKNTACYRL